MAKKNPSKPAPSPQNASSDKVDIEDLENQMILIWEKNKTLIIGGIAFVFAVFIGFQGIKLMQRSAEAKLAANYQQAETQSQKAAFAADNKGKALSGFAYKELGDAAYQEGDLSKAQEYYEAAVDSAKEPVNSAAKIALAVTLMELGNASDARDILQDLANDPESLNRAEAQYRLAQIAKSEGNAAEARSLAEGIDEEEFFWRSRADVLTSSLPEA